MATDALVRSLFQLAPQVIQGAEARGQAREDRQSQQQRDALQDALIRQRIQTAQQEAARNTPEALAERERQRYEIRNEAERERLRDAARIRAEMGGGGEEPADPRDALEFQMLQEEREQSLIDAATAAPIQRLGPAGAGANYWGLVEQNLLNMGFTPEWIAQNAARIRQSMLRAKNEYVQPQSGVGASSFVR